MRVDRLDHFVLTVADVERTGACGPMRSVYLRDPDGNLIELSVYGVAAPVRGPERATTAESVPR